MNFLDFNFWSFLLIVGVGQGIILYLVLQGKKPRHISLKVLAFLLLILTANLTEFLLMSSKYYAAVPHLMRVTSPFLFLIGPLFYFFIKAHLKPEFKFSATSWPHAIPFVLALAYTMPWLLEPASVKLAVYSETLKGINNGVSLKGFLHGFLHISQTLTYSFLALREIRKYQENGKSLGQESVKKLQFLTRFNKVFLSYWVIQLTGMFTIYIVQYYVFYIDYVLAIINSIFIQILAYQFLSQPKYLSEFELSKKYGKSSLAAGDHQALLERIEQLIRREEIYLDSDLTLQKFGEALDVNKNYVSQVINEEFGYGFTDYINNHRIEKAKALMANPDYDWMKLLGIALEAGFNNKTSFNRVFSKKTGENPSEFRKQILASREKVGHN